MAMNVVTSGNLGDEFDIGVAEANKIHVKLDAATLEKKPDGSLAVKAGGGGGDNIYNVDGTLTDDRVLDGDGTSYGLTMIDLLYYRLRAESGFISEVELDGEDIRLRCDAISGGWSSVVQISSDVIRLAQVTGNYQIDDIPVKGAAEVVTDVLVPYETGASTGEFLLRRLEQKKTAQLVYFEMGQDSGALVLDGPLADQPRYVVPNIVDKMEIVSIVLSVGSVPNGNVLVEFGLNGVAVGTGLIAATQTSVEVAVPAQYATLAAGDEIQERVTVVDFGAAGNLVVGFHAWATFA